MAQPDAAQIDTAQTEAPSPIGTLLVRTIALPLRLYLIAICHVLYIKILNAVLRVRMDPLYNKRRYPVLCLAITSVLYCLAGMPYHLATQLRNTIHINIELSLLPMAALHVILGRGFGWRVPIPGERILLDETGGGQ